MVKSAEYPYPTCSLPSPSKTNCEGPSKDTRYADKYFTVTKQLRDFIAHGGGAATINRISNHCLTGRQWELLVCWQGYPDDIMMKPLGSQFQALIRMRRSSQSATSTLRQPQRSRRRCMKRSKQSLSSKGGKCCTSATHILIPPVLLIPSHLTTHLKAPSLSHIKRT